MHKTLRGYEMASRKEFSKTVKRDVLVKCGHMCCFCGVDLVVFHHIVQCDPPDNSEDNCIPVCPNRHARMGKVDPNHSLVQGYKESELKKVRDEWYESVAAMKREAASLANRKQKLNVLPETHLNQAQKTMFTQALVSLATNTTGNICCNRHGSVVSIYGSFASDKNIIGTLPVGFRPKTTQVRMAFDIRATTNKAIAIHASGGMFLMPSLPTYGVDSSDKEYSIDISFDVNQ